jgi:hypothetical protein
MSGLATESIKDARALDDISNTYRTRRVARDSPATLDSDMARKMRKSTPDDMYG